MPIKRGLQLALILALTGLVLLSTSTPAFALNWKFWQKPKSSNTPNTSRTVGSIPTVTLYSGATGSSMSHTLSSSEDTDLSNNSYSGNSNIKVYSSEGAESNASSLSFSGSGCVKLYDNTAYEILLKEVTSSPYPFESGVDNKVQSIKILSADQCQADSGPPIVITDPPVTPPPPPGNDDTTPPAKAVNFTANPSITSVDLLWKATGDDGTDGTASKYDIRYSTLAITESNFQSQSSISTQNPKTSGQNEIITVSGLQQDTVYYFAIKIADEVPNWSEIATVNTRTLGGNYPRTNPIINSFTVSPITTKETNQTVNWAYQVTLAAGDKIQSCTIDYNLVSADGKQSLVNIPGNAIEPCKGNEPVNVTTRHQTSFGNSGEKEDYALHIVTDNTIYNNQQIFETTSITYQEDKKDITLAVVAQLPDGTNAGAGFQIKVECSQINFQTKTTGSDSAAHYYIQWQGVSDPQCTQTTTPKNGYSADPPQQFTLTPNNTSTSLLNSPFTKLFVKALASVNNITWGATRIQKTTVAKQNIANLELLVQYIDGGQIKAGKDLLIYEQSLSHPLFTNNNGIAIFENLETNRAYHFKVPYMTSLSLLETSIHDITIPNEFAGKTYQKTLQIQLAPSAKTDYQYGYHINFRDFLTKEPVTLRNITIESLSEKNVYNETKIIMSNNSPWKDLNYELTDKWDKNIPTTIEISGYYGIQQYVGQIIFNPNHTADLVIEVNTPGKMKCTNTIVATNGSSKSYNYQFCSSGEPIANSYFNVASGIGSQDEKDKYNKYFPGDILQMLGDKLTDLSAQEERANDRVDTTLWISRCIAGHEDICGTFKNSGTYYNKKIIYGLDIDLITAWANSQDRKLISDRLTHAFGRLLYYTYYKDDPSNQKEKEALETKIKYLNTDLIQRQLMDNCLYSIPQKLCDAKSDRQSAFQQEYLMNEFKSNMYGAPLGFADFYLIIKEYYNEFMAKYNVLQSQLTDNQKDAIATFIAAVNNTLDL